MAPLYFKIGSERFLHLLSAHFLSIIPENLIGYVSLPVFLIGIASICKNTLTLLKETTPLHHRLREYKSALTISLLVALLSTLFFVIYFTPIINTNTTITTSFLPCRYSCW